MRYPSRWFAPIVILTLVAGHPQAAKAQQVSADGFVRWGRAHVMALRGTANGVTDADLRPFRAMVGASRMVLLGEPTHGAHEPLAFRNRLFRFLVAKAGFTAIALETGLPESRRLQEFIDGGPGDARAVARASFTWGFGAFEENVALLQWMRAYNAQRHSRRLRIYGIDLSGGSDADSARMARALEEPLKWLGLADSGVANRAKAMLHPYRARFAAASYATLPPAERDGLTASIADLVAELERQRTSPFAVAGPRDFAWALRSAVVARQLDNFLRATPPPDSASASVWPDRPMTARDAAMAENAAWALEQEGQVGRLLVYAHNAHVMAGPLTGGSWSAFAQPPSMMGQYLRAMRGGNLFVIGMSSGDTWKASATPDSTGIDATLSRFGTPHLLLDLRRAPRHGPVAAWLHQAHALRANTTMHHMVVPASAFDALVFVPAPTLGNAIGN